MKELLAILQGILCISASGFICYLAAGLFWERSWLDVWSLRTGRTLSDRFGDNFSGLAIILLILVAAGLFYRGMVLVHLVIPL